MRGRWLTLRTRSLILLVLLATLSGCIVTYRDFPNATLASLPKDLTPDELRARLYERFYGEPLPADFPKSEK